MIDMGEGGGAEVDAPVITLAGSERHSIEKALIKCKGVIGKEKGAARLLGVPRSTLQYRMKKYGIKPRKVILVGD